MNPVFAHIIDYKNIGDSFCCPRELTPWENAVECDLDQLPDGPEPVVIGGGGLLHDKIDEWIERLSRVRPCFIWGIGLNYHEEIPSDWPRLLKHCKVVGLRDRFIPAASCFHWAPCPSVSKIDWQAAKKIYPRHPVVTYAHFGPPMPIQGPFMTNYDDKDIGVVIKFLASGESVFTNTYHGALWSILLRRRVFLWHPFSCRFFYLYPKVEVVENLKQVNWLLQQKVEVPDVLDEYLEQSARFRDKIVAEIGKYL